MKREFIKGLLPDITDEVLDKIMGENGKDVEGAKAKFADYDSMKTQLAEANTKLSGYDPEWKAKAEQAEKDAAAKIADMQFNGLLTGAITGAKGKNAKAIAALLDVDTLKGSKNQEADIKTALEALAKDNGYLFDSDPVPPPPGAPGAGKSQIGKQYTPDEIKNMPMSEYKAWRESQK